MQTIMSTAAYRTITALALALAATGAVLPLLPTTPFLLVAAWSAARHSPLFEAKLLNHPTFGPPIRTWRAERSLSRRTKLLALGALAVSLALTWFLVEAPALRGIASLVVLCVGAYLASRPEPSDPLPGA